MDAKDGVGNLSLDDRVTDSNWLALIDQLYDLVEHQRPANSGFSFLCCPMRDWPSPWQKLIARLAHTLNARILPVQDNGARSLSLPPSQSGSHRRLCGSISLFRTASTLWLDATSLDPVGFSTDEIDRFHGFMEHLRLAFSLQDDLWKRLQAVEALSQRIEQADTATAVFDERLMPVLVNRKAREIIEQEDELQFRDRTIRGSGVGQDPFARALEGVAGDAHLAGLEHRWGSVGVSFAKLPYGSVDEAVSLPFAGTCPPQAGGTIGVHIMATFHPVRVTPAPYGGVKLNGAEQALVKARYRLSGREAMVAVNVARGASIKQIAFATGRSAETVRAQLRSVFRKVGVASQRALILAVSDYLQMEHWRQERVSGTAPDAGTG